MTRRSGLVAFSVLGHALLLCVILVASVMATGIIPTPFDRVTFEMQNAIKVADVHLPASPPARAPALNVVPPNAAPIEAPTTIGPETELPVVPTTAAFSSDDAGVLIGAPTAVLEGPPPLPPPPPPPVTPVRVSTGMTPPIRVTTAEPVYPLAARAAHVEGIVIIEVVIGTDGRVGSAKILRSAPLLDQAALDAVQQWRYTPAVLNGAAVPVILTVTVNFSLSGR